MQPVGKKPSFLKKFIILEAVILFIIIGWYVYRSETYQQDIIERRVYHETRNIRGAFEYLIESSSISIRYIGKLILNGDSSDKKYIFSLLKYLKTQNNLQDVLSISPVLWLSNDRHILVNSKNGTITSKRVFQSDTNTIIKSQKNPWKLYISDIRKNNTNSHDIIFGAMSISDSSNNVVGTLVVSFDVKKINKRIRKAIKSRKIVSYIIFNRTGKISLESNDNYISEIHPNIITNYLLHNTSDSGHTYTPYFASLLKKDIVKIEKIRGMPIFVGTVIQHNYHDLSRGYRMAFFDFAIIMFISMLILLFVYKHIIIPVMQLGNIANKVIKNNSQEEIKEYSYKELEALANGLRKIILHRAELVENNEKMEYLLKRVQATNNVKSDFIRNMQHEFRTPIGHIIGSADIIASQFAGPINKEYMDYIKIINNTGKELLDIINNIIAISDFESGNVKLKEEICNLRAIIDSAVQSVMPKIKENELQLHIDVSKKLPDICVDSSKFKTALLNIINNSIKFNKIQGNINITVKRVNSGIVIKIKDTGIGIPENNLQKIFCMFEYSGDLLQKAYKGVGLGLTISINILRLHDATVNITSKVNNGTEVIINLPNIRVNTT